MKRWTNGLPGAAKRLGAMMALRGLSGSQPGCARIPMMARSNVAPLQRPDTLMQLSRRRSWNSVLHRAAGPYKVALSGRSLRCGNSAVIGGKADATRAVPVGNLIRLASKRESGDAQVR